ncbi:MAG: ADP-ribosylation factor-like protein [Promethearchaeota archaeon]
MKTAKISFLGLDNAGKTSIMIALDRKYNFQEEIDELKPTIRIERSSFKFLDISIHKHDFGGQEKFRDEYLKDKDKYLSSTDLVFYVIDVQDNERFEKSLEYFEQIAEYFREVGDKVTILVMLHKLDPKLRHNRSIIRGIKNLKKRLNGWLPYHDIYYFQSSIYDIYSLIDAFSFGMAHIFPKKELIDNYLESLGKKYDTIALLLFSEDGVPMSEYYRRFLNQEEKENIKKQFLNLQRRIMESSKNTYEFSDWISLKTRVSGVILSFSVGYLKFYVLFIIKETENEEEQTIKLLDKFESNKEDLAEILESLISNTSSVTI